MRRVPLPVLALALTLAPASHGAATANRLLYSGDWTGNRILYAADPTGRTAPAQITFGGSVSNAALSPDRQRIAYIRSGPPCVLVVARLDGSGARALARSASGCSSSDLSWSPDSRQLLYRIGDSILVERANGRGKRRIGSGLSPGWSPKGGSIAFLGPGAFDHTLYVKPKLGPVAAYGNASEFAWSPTAKWIAVVRPFALGYEGEVDLIRPGGGGVRKLADGFATTLTWSHDGRYLAFSAGGVMTVVDLSTSRSRFLETGKDSVYADAWSPGGHLLAFDGKDGLSILDATSGASRLLSPDHAWKLVWSPDGRSLAYVVRLGVSVYSSGDLRVVDLSGSQRTVVDASRAAGGALEVSGWMPATTALHFRPVVPRRSPSVTAHELISPWKVERLATDGDRIAYVSCGHIFVWTPAAGSVRQAEPAASLTPLCQKPGDNTAFEPFQVYDLALAGGRVAFATRSGNMSQTFSLYEENLERPEPRVVAGAGGYAGCGVGAGGLGELVGSSDLLVLSRWHELDLTQPSCGVRTTSQEIDRLDPEGCPCPVLQSSPGPLVPTDVDAGRIVAVGDNETRILDRTGAPILSVPVGAAAAQLAGDDLVVVRRGELLRYDSRTGARLASWPLPDVVSGPVCAGPHPWTCTAPLVLLDAARGFAAYVYAGQIHVVRLADGRDTTVGSGTTAQFFDGGLAYANGTHIHVLPFENLSFG